MITALILGYLFGISGWFLLVKSQMKYKEAARLLEAAYQSQHATPIKELVANFREFTKGFDGAISPEVDAALIQLEAHEMPKQLPAHAPEKQKEQPKKQGGRILMDKETWKLFAEDFDGESGDIRKKAVVYRWGKRYTFTLTQQCTLVKCVTSNSSKDDLREYFDKYHLS